ERTDIDPKFESIRSDQTENASVAKPALYLTPFTGQITSAVAANCLRTSGLGTIRLMQVRQHDFRVQTGIGKNDGLKFSRKNLFGDSRRFIDGSAANPENAVNYRRVVQHEELLAFGSSVFLNNLDFLLDQLRS